jgi:sugar lactone lactonase YvrE
MPDYAAWGPDGSLYVTDYQQAAIWRLPPGGGTAEVWLTDKRLDGGQFGTACILLMPDQHTLLVDQASNGGLGSLNAVLNSVNQATGLVNPTTGKLYEVPIQPGDRPGPLTQLWESGPADAPDGCALTTSGHIFIALAGASNQIVELDSSGHELARFGQQFTGTNNSSVPLDTPSGLGCLGTDLIIANQSYLAGSSANQALLDLQTGEQCAPVFVPAAPATPVHAVRARHRKHKHRRFTRSTHRKAGFTG